MDFFKLKKFGKARKSARGEGEAQESDEDGTPGNVALEGDVSGDNPEAAAAAGAGLANGGGEDGDEEEEEEEDGDDIVNDVKRRLKEIRKNNFMVKIPEDENAEVEEDGDGEEEGSSSREWMESDVGQGFPLCGFDSLYDKYCQRMLAFDKMITQTLKDSGEHIVLYLVWLHRVFAS
jgi:hypothetical protein